MSEAVIIVNYWGGIPGSLVQKSLNSLDHFKYFSNGGTFSSNVYLTNTDYIESFKDFISLKRMNGFPFLKSNSIFNIFRKNGYKVVVLGAFGLDESFNPQPIRRQYVNNASLSLEDLGVDQFSCQDGCFHTGCAYSHDHQILLEANNILENSSDNEKIVLFINLLGCTDVYKRRFDEPSKPELKHGISKQNWYLKPDVSDERLIPENVTSKKKVHWNDIFEVSKNKENELYGEYESSKVDARIKFITLQQSAWNDLRKLDDLLSRLIKTAKLKKTKLKTAITATNIISLEEHGVRKNAPVESCCKTFWCISDHILDRPYDIANKPTSILSFWNEFIPNINDSIIHTNCFVPTNVLDKKTFCVRYILSVRGKVYACNCVQSLRDLISDSSLLKTEDTNLLEICSKRNQWVLKNVKISYIFDLTEDFNEFHDIKQNCSDEFLKELEKLHENEINFFMNLNIKTIKTVDQTKNVSNTINRIQKEKETQKEEKFTTSKDKPSTTERFRFIKSPKKEKFSTTERLKKYTSPKQNKSIVLEQYEKINEKIDEKIDEKTDEKEVTTSVKKQILKFNPNDEIFNIPSNNNKVSKTSSSVSVNILRRRESDLNQKHR